jgi:hypothetical protein
MVIEAEYHDVCLDGLPKDHAMCADAGIVGNHRNSIAIGLAEQLHAEAFAVPLNTNAGE